MPCHSSIITGRAEKMQMRGQEHLQKKQASSRAQGARWLRGSTQHSTSAACSRQAILSPSTAAAAEPGVAEASCCAGLSLHCSQGGWNTTKGFGKDCSLCMKAFQTLPVFLIQNKPQAHRARLGLGLEGNAAGATDSNRGDIAHSRRVWGWMIPPQESLMK